MHRSTTGLLARGWRRGARAVARDGAVFVLSQFRRIDRTSGWIRFPYYHHVFDGERRGFERQLRYLRNYGEFLSLDAAVQLLRSGEAFAGRYFCVSFDDGLRSCLLNAVPILLDIGVPAGFFVVPKYTAHGGVPRTEEMGEHAYHGGPPLIDYMTWDDCRALSKAGMTIGAHTVTHAHLVELDAEAVRRELRECKTTIEQELGNVCGHFACPWGKPDRDFVQGRDNKIAEECGFASFFTSERGAMRAGDSPYRVRRDHLVAGWDVYQLRYFLSS